MMPSFGGARGGSSAASGLFSLAEIGGWISTGFEEGFRRVAMAAGVGRRLDDSSGRERESRTERTTKKRGKNVHAAAGDWKLDVSKGH